jgi:four helix bundle protein
MIKSLEEWTETVHSTIKGSPLWDFHVYQKVLFVYDLAWEDCGKLLKDKRGEMISRQLISSVGSISANIEEEYGRGFGPDYAYRLRIAIGEARESQGWYWRANKLLSQSVLDHRLSLFDEIIAMLVPIIKQQSNHRK